MNYSLPKWVQEDWLIDGDLANSQALVIFAHGAGADMQSEFMQQIAQGLSSNNIAVVRFNFPYMQKRLLDGKKRPPDRLPILQNYFEQIIQTVADNYPKKVLLIGKSMGGRIACMLGNHPKVSGVICLGYPFLPIKGGEPRLAPLQQAQKPVLILQGERDKFGSREQIANWEIGNISKIQFIADGDHSFKPRRLSGISYHENMAATIKYCMEFIGA